MARKGSIRIEDEDKTLHTGEPCRRSFRAGARKTQPDSVQRIISGFAKWLEHCDRPVPIPAATRCLTQLVGVTQPMGFEQATPAVLETLLSAAKPGVARHIEAVARHLHPNWDSRGLKTGPPDVLPPEPQAAEPALDPLPVHPETSSGVLTPLEDFPCRVGSGRQRTRKRRYLGVRNRRRTGQRPSQPGPVPVAAEPPGPGLLDGILLAANRFLRGLARWVKDLVR